MRFNLILCLVSTATALQCWQCENAVDMEQCSKEGELKTCSSSNHVCSTSVRRENGLTRIFKRCKQEKACQNNMMQNTKYDHGTTQCNNQPGVHSMCTCCCAYDGCNSGLEMCGPSVSSCPFIPSNIPHGKVECTAGSNVTSVCEIKCTEENYEVAPVSSDSILQCGETGSWDKDIPCCSLPCPPYALFDQIALHYSSNNETYKIIQQIGRVAYGGLDVSATDGTMYANLGFSGDVHLHHYSSFQDVLDLNFRRNVPLSNTADGLVNIGKALTWSIENMFLPGSGDRPRIRDVLIVATDKSSDDDVTEPIKAWREKGALVYVMSFPDENGVYPDRDQMLEIAGEEDHLFIYKGDLAEAGAGLFKESISHICGNICDHVLHDHE